MIEAPDYLPLGSVVSLEGNDKKLMIIGRALIVQNEGAREYYDYAFCLYPEGIIGDTLIYSNHENIKDVHFKGYSNEEDENIVNAIMEELKDSDIPKAHPQIVSTW